MEEEVFPLNIEYSGVIKYITVGILITYKSDKPIELQGTKKTDKDKPPNNLVLKDGIKEWMKENMEKSVFFSYSFEEKITPTLLFQTEADRSLFVLKWM